LIFEGNQVNMELFSERRILSVSQLTTLLRGVVEENFEHVWVQGEVSNLALPQSGHAYFTLKDSGAQLRCVMFRAAVRSLRFRLQDGMGLIARGRLTVYDQRGDYQLVVEYLEPQGLGALQLAFQQLKERLGKEGLFAAEHKKPLPLMPQRIGIVTSPTGAAIHDILTVLRRRSTGLAVLLAPVKVQGAGAASEIAAAIRDFNRYGGVDVLIVGRGGGSLEDLWAFNEEEVVRAIHGSRIPVISAVGHEIDVTISDLVADLRAPTPSAAAEVVVRSKLELAVALQTLRQRLRLAILGRLNERRHTVQMLSRLLKDPVLMVGHHEQRVDDLTSRLQQAVQRLLERSDTLLTGLHRRLQVQEPSQRLSRDRERHQRLATQLEQAMDRLLTTHRRASALATARLDALSPLAVLARGYALVLREPEGTVVRTSTQLAPGDRVHLRLHVGAATCRVEQTIP
jgi:exodeoxyribonuclease VII large subunit